MIHKEGESMTDTLAVEIPADVKDNSGSVTDYAFRRDLSPNRGVVTPAERDRQIKLGDLSPSLRYTVHSWTDVNPDGQRCRFDMIVNRTGHVVYLFHTEFWTRVGCTDCEYSYAGSYIAVTDADGVTHPAAPFCDEHGRVVKKITERNRGYSWAESEGLRIGQHD